MPTPQEQLLPYALTTLQRVKDILSQDNANWDQVLNRLINSATDFIESECNGRRFVLTKYINDVQSTVSSQQKKLILRQCPVYYLNIVGNTVAGSKQITNVQALLTYGAGAGSSIKGIQVGMPIMGGDDGAGS